MNEKRKRDPKLIKNVVLIILLCVTAIIISTILLVNNETIKQDLIGIISKIIIIASTLYSGIIFKTLFKNVCFGVTRKKFFNSYVKILITILCLLICFILVVLIVEYILNVKEDYILVIKVLVSYISIYVFLNGLIYMLSTLIKQKYVCLIISFIFDIVLIIFNIPSLLGLFNLLFLLFGICIIYIDYQLTMNKKIYE